MLKALVITIGTEITCGEVVNTNAAWVSRQLEELGVRVFSHLSVRDQADEIAQALKWSKDYSYIIVTGGLGPTSDDITRASMANYTAQPLEFDHGAWTDLEKMYVERQLPLRQAHRHQCWFPRGSERLKNPAGSALGFAQTYEGRSYFVLPGPPRELEAMWREEVVPRLQPVVSTSTKTWVRWICLGAPESEVAELVEKEIHGRDIEVGYRAQVPYVKVKVFVDPQAQADVVTGIEATLSRFVVGHGDEDLAEEVLKLWPTDELQLSDRVSGAVLASRLLAAWKALDQRGERTAALSFSRQPLTNAGMSLRPHGEEWQTELRAGALQRTEKRSLPYKVSLNSERGRRSAAEWALWFTVRALRAQASTSST